MIQIKDDFWEQPTAIGCPNCAESIGSQQNFLLWTHLPDPAWKIRESALHCCSSCQHFFLTNTEITDAIIFKEVRTALRITAFELQSKSIGVDRLIQLRATPTPSVDKIYSCAMAYTSHPAGSADDLEAYVLLWKLLSALHLTYDQYLKDYMEFYYIWAISNFRTRLRPEIPWALARFDELLTPAEAEIYLQRCAANLESLRLQFRADDVNRTMALWVSSLESLRRSLIAAQNRGSEWVRQRSDILAVDNKLQRVLDYVDSRASQTGPAKVAQFDNAAFGRAALLLEALNGAEWASLRTLWKTKPEAWQEELIYLLGRGPQEPAVDLLADIIKRGSDKIAKFARQIAQRWPLFLQRYQNLNS